MIPQPKPARGSYRLQRKKERAEIKLLEDSEKAKVRIRDKKCRWPHCRHKQLRLEVAHIKAKGIGGDHALRSNDYEMVLLCIAHHQWDIQDGHPEGSIERHTLKIEPLTDAGSNGPMAFYRQFVRMGATKLYEEWIEVGRERSVGVLETSAL